MVTVGEGSVVGGIVNQGVGSAAGEGTAVGASVDTTVGDAASMVVVPGSGVGTTGCSGVGTTVGGAGVTVGNGIEVGDGLGRDAGGRVGGVRVAVGITAFSVGPTAIAGCSLLRVTRDERGCRSDDEEQDWKGTKFRKEHHGLRLLHSWPGLIALDSGSGAISMD